MTDILRGKFPLRKKPFRILIAQQGTITPYRVPLFEQLARRKPADWDFVVVCEADVGQHGEYYTGKDGVSSSYGFPTMAVRTTKFNLMGRTIRWQNFFLRASTYDLVITDNYLKILTYPALTLYRMFGLKRVIWGIPGDPQVPNPRGIKRLSEWIKAGVARLADGFFVYTEGSARALEDSGYPVDRITVLNNTIDIDSERSRALSLAGQRRELREKWGIGPDRIVVTSIGRLNRDKRAERFGPVAESLHQMDSRLLVLVAGSGPLRAEVESEAQRLGPEVIRYLGTLDGPMDAPEILALSDLHYMPGYVGLAPLQAACYDLPTIAHHLSTHSPEVEYLNPSNGLFVRDDPDAEGIARQILAGIPHLLSPAFREGIWASISYLTMDAMVDRYIDGINRVLGVRGTVAEDAPVDKPDSSANPSP